MDCIPHYLRPFRQAPVPVDVFPFTQDEFRNNSLPQHGLLLCDRRQIPSVRERQIYTESQGEQPK
ncbi:MAG: hypothetical protein ACREOO_26880 [bacterium]